MCLKNCDVNRVVIGRWGHISKSLDNIARSSAYSASSVGYSILNIQLLFHMVADFAADYSPSMESTWASRDLPVLTAVVELWEETFPSTSSIGRLEVVQRTGLANDDVDRAISALIEAGYLEWVPNRGGDRIYSWRITGISSGARRLVGQWPSPEELVKQIVSALEVAAENEPDAEKRSKLKSAASSIGSFAKDSLHKLFPSLGT